MNLDAFRSRLEGVRGNGTRFMARCPSHEDKNPSLSVEDKGDRIVLHCFAGCDSQDVLEAMGLSWSDTFADSKPTMIRPSLRVEERRRLARSHAVEFAVLSLADQAKTEADIRRIAQAESRLERLARQYGTDELAQIASSWEDGDCYPRRRTPEDIPEALELARQEAQRVSR